MNYDIQACHQVSVPIFRPTIEEFQNFSKYIESLETAGAHKVGLAKVILLYSHVHRQYFLRFRADSIEI